MDGGVLDKQSILELIRSPRPLLEGYRDLDVQLQSNGFDLTLREVHRITSAGGIGSGAGRASLSQHCTIPFEADGRLQVPAGSYLITLNEVVDLPPNLMAIGRPRSSLLRSGVAIHTAVWDAGYRGRSQALLMVYNPNGYSLERDARLLQLVFMYLVRPVEEGYRGRYLDENI